jgi:O-antigen ligase
MRTRLAYVLCCTALVLTTIAYGGVHQPVIAIFYALVSVAAVSVTVHAIRTGVLEINREALQVPLIAAAVYAFLQSVPLGTAASTAGLEGIPQTITLDPYSTLITALQLTAFVIFFAVILMCLSSAKRISKSVTFITVFGFVFGFFAILQSVLSPEKIYGIYDVSLGSPFGSFVNRNNFAAFMEMSAALPLGLIFSGAVLKDKRLLYLTFIILMGVALLLSRSRGGFVALLAELILLFFLTRDSSTRRGNVLRIGLIVMLVVAILAGSIFVGGDTSLTRFAETAGSEDFSAQRSHIWTVSTKVIAANLPLGAGFGAFAVAYTAFDDSSGLARVEQAHNDYLQVVADAGIPGLLLGLLFLFLFFRIGFRLNLIKNDLRRGIALGAFAGCFAALVHSIFDFVLHVTAVALLFLFLLALLSASLKDYPDDIENEHQKRRSRKKKRSEDEVELPLRV